MYAVLAAVSLHLLTGCFGQDIPLQPNFTLPQYVGLWYELYHLPMPFESGTDTTAFYEANPDGTVGVTNKEWLPKKNEWNVAKAYANVVGNAQLEVHFTDPAIPGAGDYRVLYTDYTGVSFVYGVSKIGTVKVEYGWILARKRKIDANTTEMAFALFEERTGVNRTRFETTEHGIAPIPLQANFSLTDYVGLWYELYHLPMPFESGTDTTAYYEPNPDGTVGVTNKEWLPKKNEWNVAKAYANVIGNAQLEVHFTSPPIPGAGDYRVLYTDYSGVSLVYGVSKVGTIKVEYGWILCRKRKIDVNTTNMAFKLFEERTGVERSQFAKTEHGVAPIPLQANFSLTDYVGLWYELYHLPMPFESGTDTTAFYEANPDGTVGVTNKEWLQKTNEWNVAKAYANVIGNAQLEVHFTSPPIPGGGDYRVLYSDYTGISLVYGVSKMGTSKVEFGWILCRKRKIDVNTTDMAFKLFEDRTGVERSQFAKTEHGVAPIPLQANFSLTDYVGLWYELYHLPMPFQSGTDTTAFYEANPDGTVGVTNKEWLPKKSEWNVAKAYANVVGNAQLEVHFTDPPIPGAGDYRVLYSDYNGISLVYGASKVGTIKVEYGWVLCRKRKIDSKTSEMAFKLFEERTGVERSQFLATEHGVAPIPLQANFSLTDYVGLWYELYHLPMPFESGTDTTAFYEANPDGTVGVTNKEWLPKTNEWNVAKAYANVLGNAQLEVHFTNPPIPGAGDYRVLFSDYTDISLVYGVSKVGTVKVEYGWILSRKRKIDANTTEMAFKLFEDRTGVEKSQFKRTEHGTAPIPLQANFTLTQYVGLWYEMYRVPVPFEFGTDNTAFYEAKQEDGTVGVTNKEWLPTKKQWSVAKGYANVLGNAWLEVYFTEPFVPVSGDYRVLYSDYTNVAVVYGQSRVMLPMTETGWILSRKPKLDTKMAEMAFAIFEERTSLLRSDFHQTQHGVAPGVASAIVASRALTYALFLLIAGYLSCY